MSHHTTEQNRPRRKTNLYDLGRDHFQCISAIPTLQGDTTYLTRTSESGGGSGIDHFLVPETAYNEDPTQNRLLAGDVDLEIGPLYVSSDHYPCYLDMTFHYTFQPYPKTEYNRRRYRAITTLQVKYNESPPMTYKCMPRHAISTRKSPYLLRRREKVQQFGQGREETGQMQVVQAVATVHNISNARSYRIPVVPLVGSIN